MLSFSCSYPPFDPPLPPSVLPSFRPNGWLGLICCAQAAGVLFGKMGQGQVENDTLDKVKQLVESLQVSRAKSITASSLLEGGAQRPVTPALFRGRVAWGIPPVYDTY